MNRLLIMAAAALVIFPVTAKAQMSPITELPAGLYEVDKTHASITWKVMHLGLAKYTARFNTFNSAVILDPAAVENSTVTVDISPMSIETDYPNPEKEDFDKKLATGEDWFNVGTYPDIKFVSKSIEKTGENTANISGDLTFLGVTKPVTLDATLNGAMASHPFTKKGAFGISAHTTIKRSDWGMKGGLPHVGDEVEVMIEAEYFQADAPAQAE